MLGLEREGPTAGKTLAGGSMGTSQGLTEEPADGSDGLEEGLGEAGSEAQGTAIGQPQDDGSVLRPEEEAGVGQDPVFVQWVCNSHCLFCSHQMAWSDQSCLRSAGPQAKGEGHTSPGGPAPNAEHKPAIQRCRPPPPLPRPRAGLGWVSLGRGHGRTALCWVPLLVLLGSVAAEGSPFPGEPPTQNLSVPPPASHTPAHWAPCNVLLQFLASWPLCATPPPAQEAEAIAGPGGMLGTAAAGNL